MIQVKRLQFFLLTLLIVCLSSCLYRRNYLKTFGSIDKIRGYTEAIDNVILFIKALNNNESKDFFKVDLVKNGYVPLYIKISNLSSSTLIIRPSYVDLVPCSSQRIAKLLHYDTSFYSVGLAVPALIFWWPATIAVGSMGYDMYRANKKTNQRVAECTLYGQPLKILPYEIVEKFLFVHQEDYLPFFEFKIFNKDQKKLLTFYVDLMK
ncbi:MAG: hypothetical protein ACYC2U_08675 [Candidatus Amoebophilus sp.]